MIKKEDLLPGTTAKYGIEYESVIMDEYYKKYMCLYEHKIYDNHKKKMVSKKINELLEEFHIEHIFDYHPSLSPCKGDNDKYKRVEFASKPFTPNELKPSLMFKNLENLIEAFYNWTDKEFYLPDHGSIAYFDPHTEKIWTSPSGGTHITISFPLTINDNPVRWKAFIWLFMGLLTMYEPMYIALNGAPSQLTKGSDRQRVSGSVNVGSAYIYDIFTLESERYEIFINSPTRHGYTLPDYPTYAYWNSDKIQYNGSTEGEAAGPWRENIKCDIGNSYYTRADVFDIHHNKSIYENRNTLIDKKFHENYININEIGGVTSNLFEFRFFDNEPINHLLNKFNLIIRIADYAYEQASIMEEAIGINDLHTFIKSQIDDKLNIRPLMNVKAWHDAVNEAMIKGLDATFNEEFIDACYEAFQPSEFTLILDNPKLKEITAIDLHELFIDEINNATHHFSEYFQTDNPTPSYSKEHQIKKYEESLSTATEQMHTYIVEKERKEEEERVRKAKIEEDRNLIIATILDENLLKLQQTNIALYGDIINYIDRQKFIDAIRYKIYYLRNNHVQDFFDIADELIEYNLISTLDKIPKKELIQWFRESLLPDLREKEPRLKEIEDNLELQRERDRLNASQLQREREAIEQKIVFIQNIIVKNVENTNEQLKDYILTSINARKLSALLKELIYDSHDSPATIGMNAPRNLYVSTLENVSWNYLPTSVRDSLIIWFRDSLVPDLVSNILELQLRPTQSVSQQLNSEAQINAIERKIRDAIVDHTEIPLNNLIYSSISFKKLSELMQNWIYNLNYTTVNIRDNAIEIIEKTKFGDLTPEQHENVIYWIKGILIDILKEITPIQETRTSETSEILNRQRIQPEEPNHIPSNNDERQIYESILKSITRLDDDNQSIIKNYIDIPKLTNEIYIRIKDHYSTEQIKGMASLITQTSIYDNTTIPDTKKQILDSWFEHTLITQLISDNILNPIELTGLSVLFG